MKRAKVLAGAFCLSLLAAAAAAATPPARVPALAPGIHVVNYGCPGESTTTFIHGGCSGRGDVKALHDAFNGTQLGAALAFLRAHRGQVSPITLTLLGERPVRPRTGVHGRPLLHSVTCVGRPCALCLAADLDRQPPAFRRADGGDVLTRAWNFDVQHFAQSEPPPFRVAHMYPVFGKARICAMTFICTKNDPHPTDAGYRAMAAAFLAASGYPKRS